MKKIIKSIIKLTMIICTILLISTNSKPIIKATISSEEIVKVKEMISYKDKEAKNDESLFKKYNKKFSSNFIKEYEKMLNKYCSDTQGYYNTDREAKILDLNDDGSICDGNEIQEKNAEKIAKLPDINDINKPNWILWGSIIGGVVVTSLVVGFVLYKKTKFKEK